MAQLITMRQRIKAVETIKKITHAMRLISMSTHSRLRHKKVNLEQYKKAFQALWARVQPVMTTVQEPTTHVTAQQHLIILVGSQKGLCGTFNSSLFRFLDHEEPKLGTQHHLIAIGKSAIDHCALQNKVTLATYNELTPNHFVAISQAVTDIIIDSPTPYATVTVYSNYQKNFFVQKPRKSVIFPLTEETTTESSEPTIEYLFEQSPEELSATIRHLMLAVTLQEILFDSLLAEHAARFISMDSSTRNAESLLIDMKLEYNKTRQTAITRELTELSTTF